MANVHGFGARGDGQTDDTAALQHALERGDGVLEFPRGDYVVSSPLVVPLAQRGRLALTGQGGVARLVMHGPGPAIHLVGTHARTALPADFAEGVWRHERFPTLADLEIVGGHEQADGIRLEGVMQPTLSRLLIRKCRHGVHLVKRARNVLIADCHIYDNSGIGIFLEGVNLHQTNIVGNHISYCRQGGLRIVASEVRNIQITGNDIEYNFDPKLDGCADVCFDCRNGTVREGTIVSNTIQAKQSPNGANVRLIGVGRDDPNAVGLLAITGNLIGSQETALHLQACRGVVVTGNSIYSGYLNAILAEHAEHLVLGPNSIDHNPEYRGKSTDRVVLRNCRNVNFMGTILQHTLEAAEQPEASLTIADCEGVNVTGCQIIQARTRGIDIRSSRRVRIADCTIRGQANDPAYLEAVRVQESTQVMIVNNFLGRGSRGTFTLPDGSGLAAGNL